MLKKSTLRNDSYRDAARVQVYEEQLDITKRSIQTGEVTIHRETFTEERTITVPVTHEELVIVKENLNADSHTEGDSHKEIIRIPISTEQIEVIKHPVVLEDVKVYKRQFQKTQHIKEHVKKVKLHVKTPGNMVYSIDRPYPGGTENNHKK